MKQKRNEKGQFVKGMTPWNLGKKGVNGYGGNERSFKSGRQHPKYKPIGSERINKNDIVEIKVDERKWMTKHRYLWEKANGAVPKGHVVIFANGNRRDFSTENLLLVSRKQLMVMNKNNLIQDGADLTKTGLIVADLMLAINAAERGKGD